MTAADPVHTLPVVAFDESGNTGQQLLDAAQPVFVLASVHLPHDEAARLAAAVVGPQAREAKFAQLKKSGAGMARVRALLGDSLITPERVKLAIYHKGFLVTTKIVDVLVETLLDREGISLYERAANLGLANMWHHVMPVFCTPESVETLRQRFVTMCRAKSAASVEAFYAHVEAMRALNKKPEFDGDLGMLARTQEVVDQAIEEDEKTLLDPHVPAFVDLAAQWTASLDVPFDAVNDPSAPLAHFREHIELLMSFSEPSRRFGHPGHERQYPILTPGLRFADSVSEPAVQVADVLAGAAAAAMGAIARGTVDDIARQILDSPLRAILEVSEPIWPDTAVTPEELGADHPDGGEALDFMIDLAARERGRRSHE